MPMFEYQCTDCGTRTERLSWGNDRAPLRCACGSEQLERVWYSRVAVSTGSSSQAGGASACDSNPGGCCGGGACAVN